jgi:hypothetical protein
VIITHGRFIFGTTGDKPILPPGFSFIEREDDFLRATRDFGITCYFVTSKALVPQSRVRRRDVRRTNHRLKLGQTFADMNPRHKIRLP